MLFEPFTEKVDVYSFGIILWELLTRDQPFKNHKNYKKCKKAVCEEKERPIIPNDCEPTLNDLIKRCWDHDPEVRPPFVKIVELLKDIMVNVSVSDVSGRQFWKKHFISYEEVTTVPYSEFESKFYEYLKIKDDNNEEDKLTKKCLQALFSHVSESETEKERIKVGLEQFGKLLHWFGPMDVPEGDEKRPHKITESIRLTCSERWFYGDITIDQAKKELKFLPVGYFLVRFSESQPGFYTLSQLSPENKVVNKRIKHSLGGPFVYDNKNFSSLKELIEKSEGFTNPCTSFMYKKIFDISDELPEYLDEKSKSRIESNQ